VSYLTVISLSSPCYAVYEYEPLNLENTRIKGQSVTSIIRKYFYCWRCYMFRLIKKSPSGRGYNICEKKYLYRIHC